MRREEERIDGIRRTTFVHRRFQEYFATAYLQEHQDFMTPDLLLTQLDWRDITVTLLQTQPPDTVRYTDLLAQAKDTVQRANRLLPQLNTDESTWQAQRFERLQSGVHWEWPPHLRHVLGVLDEGLSRRGGRYDPTLQDGISSVLTSATVLGNVVDQQWALELLGTAPTPTQVLLVRRAFVDGSLELRNTAFRMVGRLRRLPADIAFEVRLLLLRIISKGELRHQRLAIAAQLWRLTPSRTWRPISTLITRAWMVFATLTLAVSLWRFFWFSSQPQHNSRFFGALYAIFLLATAPFAYRAAAALTSMPKVPPKGRQHKASVEMEALKSSAAQSFSPRLRDVAGAYAWLLAMIFISGSDGRPAMGNVLGGLLVLYAILWLLSAFGLLRLGKYQRIRFWILYPLLGIFELLRLSRRLASKSGLSGIGACGVGVGIIVWISTRPSQTQVDIANGLLIAMGVFASFVFATLVVALLFMARERSADRKIVGEWEESVDLPLEVDESLRTWLPKFRTEKYLFKFISEQGRQFEQPLQAVDFLSRLLAALELYRLQSSAKSQKLFAEAGYLSTDTAAAVTVSFKLGWWQKIKGKSPRAITLGRNDNHFDRWMSSSYDDHAERLGLYSIRCRDELAVMLRAARETTEATSIR